MKNILRGSYSSYRVLITVINIVTLICMIILGISSIMISRDIFSFLHIKGGFIIRSIHTTAAQWGLLFVSVHLGLHWHMILRLWNGKTIRNYQFLYLWMLRGVMFVIAVKGVKSFFNLNIGTKLTMRDTFGYWDFENHPIDFFVSYVSIMGLYITITYYIAKLLRKNK